MLNKPNPMNLKNLLFIFLALWGIQVTAKDDIRFTASSKPTVAVGERFNLTFTVNAKGSNFRAPGFTDFRLISGPFQSQSSSTQIINGDYTQSVTISYTYVLEALKEGEFTIAPAVIRIDGKDYTSNQVKITVTASGAGYRQGSQDSQGGRSGAQASGGSREIFLKAVANKTNPYQGEQVIVTYKLYTRVQVLNYNIEKLPSFEGFWSENINSNRDNIQGTTEWVDGVQYNVYDLRQIVLFPQKSGSLTLAPLDMDVTVRRVVQGQRGGGMLDEFFGPSFFSTAQAQKESLKSNALIIEAKALPAQNRPSSFNGLVGNYSIKSGIDREALAANDAVNLSFTISGKGNIKMIEAPSINFPPNLEVYDPKINDNISASASGISGSRAFEYLIIPRTGGEYELPETEIAYFDPSSSSYHILKIPSYKLQVSKAEGEAGETYSSAVAQEDVQFIGSDVRFVITKAFNLKPIGSVFFASPLFFLLLLIPLILFALFIILWRRRIKLHSDTALLRNRKADRIAQKRLKTAKNLMDKNDEPGFYAEISKALWGYISDKLNIPTSRLSSGSVQQAFEDQKLDTAQAADFLKILDNCEFARFAPGKPEEKMDSVFQGSLQLIRNIEKNLKISSF